MSQDKRIVVVVVAGMIMTGVFITGCAIRVPSSEIPAMNLGPPAKANEARSQSAAPAKGPSSID